MTPERFERLAEAYGGELERWPSAERGEARDHLAHNPAAADVLARAQGLDGLLDGYAVAAPIADTQRRMVGTLLGRRDARVTIRRWLSGLGALGVLGAGAAAGAAGMALVMLAPPTPTDVAGLSPLYAQTGFGDLTVPDDGPNAARS